MHRIAGWKLSFASLQCSCSGYTIFCILEVIPKRYWLAYCFDEAMAVLIYLMPAFPDVAYPHFAPGTRNSNAICITVKPRWNRFIYTGYLYHQVSFYRWRCCLPVESGSNNYDCSTDASGWRPQPAYFLIFRSFLRTPPDESREQKNGIWCNGHQ